MEIDHIFVCVELQVPEAEFLKDFGLTEGIRRIHQGQGTANVCFFFHNVYLELLWLNDSNEIQSPVVSSTGLWQRCRWQETKACPFGIALRRVTPNLLEIPFSTWNYYAPYLPSNAFIPILANSENLSEPLIFISPSSQKPANYPLEKQRPLTHQAGFLEITALRVFLPGDKNFSLEVTKLSEIGIIEFSHGNSYHLEIEFDSGKEGRLHNFHLTLPISFQW
ncbi:VOC family protein [Amazonocrinis nigriterrae]|uniref:VOC family protein n=1 Tax=Amazonocrinis nigriterrae TaxID=2840443 RepID=UPI001BE44072|nr:VOC family protein [Amazonocrinis nigriterrae]